jgi:hypothetical protein
MWKYTNMQMCQWAFGKSDDVISIPSDVHALPTNITHRQTNIGQYI